MLRSGNSLLFIMVSWHIFISTLNRWISEQNGNYSHFKNLYDRLLEQLEGDEKEMARVDFEDVE